MSAPHIYVIQKGLISMSALSCQQCQHLTKIFMKFNEQILKEWQFQSCMKPQKNGWLNTANDSGSSGSSGCSAKISVKNVRPFDFYGKMSTFYSALAIAQQAFLLDFFKARIMSFADSHHETTQPAQKTRISRAFQTQTSYHV